MQFGDWIPMIVAIAITIAALLLGFALRRTLLVRLQRLAARTGSKADDIIVASLSRPLPLWVLLGGLYVGARLVEIPADVTSIVEKLLLSLLILSVTIWAAELGARLLQIAGATGTRAGTAATGVVRYAVKVLVLGVGGLVLLSTLGISVAPVLTTVGIGGIAVALGLQDTLSNLFAGMQVTLAGNLRVGDFIKLETGEEGYIEDIHWRATRVRTLPDNFVLIPNSRLAQSVVTNYHRPATDLAVLVPVGVHYSSDLEQVERVTREVARSIMKTVKGGVPEFEPFVRYHTFADSSINFTVILRAKEFTDSFLVKHEFIKALARVYAAEGIVIPFPIRAINLEQERDRREQIGPRPCGVL